MRLGYGLITCQRYPGDPRTAQELYREALELTELCEASGLDSAWTSEHHFWDDDYMPSLLVMSAAMAARTKSISIGTGVLLAPLYHPIRLAEDAATVDLISGGRLILGLGIGWRAEEFDRLGIPMEGLGRRMSETVKILRAAWGPSTFTHKGKAYDIEPTNVTPKPSGQIPIWLGGFVDDALRRAGRIADGFLGSAMAFGDIERRMGLVREGLVKSSRSEKDFTFAVHEPVWVTEDGEDPEEILTYINNSRWKYENMGPAFGRTTDGPLPQTPALDDTRREWISARLISGDPGQVAARLKEFSEAMGEGVHFVARSNYPGVPHERARRAVELLGEVKSLL